MAEFSGNIYNYLVKLYGEDSANKYIEFINQDSTQYIRVNKLVTSREELSLKLNNNYGITTESVKNLPFVLKVTKDEKNILGKTIEHILGEYYIQSLSSMIPPVILNPNEDDIVLDLCAAPGSKSTQLAEIMNNKGTLIANEVSQERVRTLIFNVERMRLLNTGIVHQKGEWLGRFYTAHFDKILVDAPCSGLGIIQKKNEVNNWWSVERANALGELQLKLLVSAIKMAKVGGEIVYSTCTLTPEENESVINKVLNKYPVELEEIDLPIPSRPGFDSYDDLIFHPSITKTRRIIPWESNSEGFFVAKLKKYGETDSPIPAVPKESNIKLFTYKNKEVNNLLKIIENIFGVSEEILSEFYYYIKSGDLYFLTNTWQDEFPGMFQRFGSKLGILDKHSSLTLHTQGAQILSKFITKQIYELNSVEELKKYLEGGIIRYEEELKGQCVVKFKNYLIGTAVITQAGIKSRFPRSKRTQEIFLDF